MGIRVVYQSGNLSSATPWYDGNNYAAPRSFTSTSSGIGYITNNAILYTPYFTPSNATDTCVGCVLSIYRPSSGSGTAAKDFTLDLMEGSTVRATAVVKLGLTGAADVFGGVGSIFFLFSTPYQYLNTTAGTWRFRLTSGSNDSVLRIHVATGTTTQLAYIEVLNTSTAPTDGDTLVICGNGTVSGTYNTGIQIVVDTSLTLGNISLDGANSAQEISIQIGLGGSLSWGTSQAASYTLTCPGNIHAFSSDGVDNTFEMGTSANPLTATYVQTVLFTNASFINGVRVGLSQVSSAGYNRAVPRCVIRGNWQFNQASETLWRTTNASQSSSGQKDIVLTDDLGLRAGGGDIILIEGDVSNQNEWMTAASYDSGTKTFTSTVNLSYTHTVGSRVFLASCNAVISGNSASLPAVMAQGTTAVPSYPEYFDIKFLEGNCAIGGGCQYAAIGSSISYVRSRGSSDGSNARYVHQLGKGESVSQCLFTGTAYMYAASIAGTEYEDCVFLNNTTVIYVNTPSAKFRRCLFLKCTIAVYGYSNQSYDECEFTQASYSSTGGATQVYLANNDVFLARFTNSIAGRLATTYFLHTQASEFLIQAKFINLNYNCTNLIYEPNIKLNAQGTSINFQSINGVGSDCRIYQPEGTLYTTGAGLTDTLTKTAGEISLKLAPYDTAVDPVFVPITKPVKANQTAAWYGYFRKNSSYGSTTLPSVTLTSDDGEIDVTATLTDVDDTWVFFTVSGQVGAADTVINLILTAQSVNASAAAYFADMQLVIGDVTKGSAAGFKVGTLWKDGEPTADELLGGTVDGNFLATSVWGSSKALTTGKFLALK